MVRKGNLFVVGLALLWFLLAGIGQGNAERAAPATPLSLPGTRVVVLGTGTPAADPERFGPAVAIVVNDRAYLVDCGPGVVRRAAAAEKNGVAALDRKSTRLNSSHLGIS